MIKIGSEKLFTMTEILETTKVWFKDEPIADLQNDCASFEISCVAAIIGESPDFVKGYVIAGRK